MTAQRVVVAVEWPGDAHIHDLEVPSDVPSARLVWLIAQALGYDLENVGGSDGVQLHADPPGRSISRTETLAQAGVANGASLRVDASLGSPAALSTASVPAIVQLGTDEPLFEFAGPDAWGDLLPPETTSDVQLPPASAKPGAESYVWKRID